MESYEVELDGKTYQGFHFAFVGFIHTSLLLAKADKYHILLGKHKTQN